jgi:hypothetical protein
MTMKDSRRAFLATAAGVAAMFGLPSMPVTQSFLTAGTTSMAYAQTYPSQPIRIIVPFAPGGSTDVVARLISDSLSRQLGQAVVIENKGGAGGTIGTMEVVRAPPDGHTLLMASPSITAANPAINPAAKYQSGIRPHRDHQRGGFTDSSGCSSDFSGKKFHRLRCGDQEEARRLYLRLAGCGRDHSLANGVA